MVAARGGTGNQARLLGARAGHAAGSLDVAAAAVDQRFDLASNPATTGITAGSRQRTCKLGAAYNFRVIRLLGCVVRDQRDRLQETRASISGVVPLGSGEIHVGYDHSTLSNDLAPVERGSPARREIGGGPEPVLRRNFTNGPAVHGRQVDRLRGRAPALLLTRRGIEGDADTFASGTAAGPALRPVPQVVPARDTPH